MWQENHLIHFSGPMDAESTNEIAKLSIRSTFDEHQQEKQKCFVPVCLTDGVVYSLAMWKILLLNANLENNESCGIGHLGQRVLHKGKKKVQMRFNKLFIFRTNCETAIGTAGLLNWGLCDKTKQKLDMSSIDTENSIQEKKNTFFKKLTFSLKKNTTRQIHQNIRYQIQCLEILYTF